MKTKADLKEGPEFPLILGLCFLLVVIWRGGVCLQLGAHGQGGGRILDVDGQGDGGLENWTFSWTSYVYRFLYVKRCLRSAITSIKTEATNGLVINQVNISNSIPIILTKFAVTVVRLQLSYVIFKHFNT